MPAVNPPLDQVKKLLEKLGVAGLLDLVARACAERAKETGDRDHADAAEVLREIAHRCAPAGDQADELTDEDEAILDEAWAAQRNVDPTSKRKGGRR